MHYAYSSEQNEFREVVRRFLERHSPSNEVRRLMATSEGFDRAVWQQLGQELAITGIHIPEAYGGAGFGFEELAIASEEMGRALLCAPWFGSSVLAATAILNGGDEAARKALLPAIATGECIATLALSENTSAWDPGSIAMSARADAGHYVLEGRKCFVIDGHIADRLIVAARSPGSSGENGISLFSVPGDAAGLERRLLDTLDQTRKQAELVFRAVKAELIGPIGGAAAAIARTMDQANVALACEMMGGAQALLDAALEYAKMRMQFGRPIGSFQAIKHKFADLLLQVELAKSAARYAAAAVDADDPELPALASLAKATASDAYMRTAVECIQIHGGIGFTWDQDTHLWFKRAKSSQVMFGDGNFHRERYMEAVAA